MSANDDLLKRFRQAQLNVLTCVGVGVGVGSVGSGSASTADLKSSLVHYHALLVDLFAVKRPLDTLESSASQNQMLFFLLMPLVTCAKRMHSAQLVASSSSSTATTRHWCDVHELMLKSMRLALEHLRLADQPLFADLINVCSLALVSNNNPNKTASAPPVLLRSEEFFIECFGVIRVLFERSERRACLARFFTFRSMSTVGLLVSAALSTVCEQSSLDVRLQALAALDALMLDTTSDASNGGDDDDDDERNSRRGCIGVMFASFLPGIAIKLVQAFLLAHDLALLNHKLIAATLRVLGTAIGSVFDDTLLDQQWHAACFQRLMAHNQRTIYCVLWLNKKSCF